jgi:hypothetical protein
MAHSGHLGRRVAARPGAGDDRADGGTEQRSAAPLRVWARVRAALLEARGTPRWDPVPEDEPYAGFEWGGGVLYRRDEPDESVRMAGLRPRPLQRAVKPTAIPFCSSAIGSATRPRPMKTRNAPCPGDLRTPACSRSTPSNTPRSARARASERPSSATSSTSPCRRRAPSANPTARPSTHNQSPRHSSRSDPDRTPAAELRANRSIQEMDMPKYLFAAARR